MVLYQIFQSICCITHDEFCFWFRELFVVYRKQVLGKNLLDIELSVHDGRARFLLVGLMVKFLLFLSALGA